METIVPNQLINPRGNALLFRKNPQLVMKRLLLLLVVMLYGITINAQDLRMNDNPLQVSDVNSFLSSMRASEQNRRATYSNAAHIEDLIHKVQPSVYYFSGSVKTYGEKPKNLFTDIPSLSGLSNADILKNNIELVVIKIKNAAELNSAIDLSMLSGYKNLKYIYIVSGVSTTQENITRMIRNYEEKYSVFYKIDKGDNNQ